MNHDLPTEPDRVPGGGAALAFVAVIVAIFASAIVVWLYLGPDPAGGGRSNIEKPPIAPNPSAPFSTETAHEQHRAAQAAALARWQWADRTHTKVRVPIDIAMDLYVERRQP